MDDIRLKRYINDKLLNYIKYNFLELIKNGRRGEDISMDFNLKDAHDLYNEFWEQYNEPPVFYSYFRDVIMLFFKEINKWDPLLHLNYYSDEMVGFYMDGYDNLFFIYIYN